MAERSVPLEIERAQQVFRFLKAFAERNLPIQRRLADQPWAMTLAEAMPWPRAECERTGFTVPTHHCLAGHLDNRVPSPARPRRGKAWQPFQFATVPPPR
jgi:hypothetical protein